MTSEALTTRLTRERLASLKKYIPLRDHVRDKLQHRQEAQTDFSIGREELFAPVTKATKDMKLATEHSIWGEKEPTKDASLISVLGKIATETEKTQRGIQQLSGELQAQRKIQRMGGIDIDDGEQEELFEDALEDKGAITSTEVETVSTQRGVSFKDKLTDEAIAVIRRFQLMKPADYKAFGNFAVQSFYDRQSFLKDEYKDSKIPRNIWIDWMYKTNQKIDRVKTKSLEYKEFRKGIDEYDTQPQQPQQREQKEKSGKG